MNCAPLFHIIEARRQLPVQFGFWLKGRRQARGLTQGQAARKIGVAREHWARFETGDSAVSAEKAIEIAQAFDLPVKEVLHRAGFNAGLEDVEVSVTFHRFKQLSTKDQEAVTREINTLYLDHIRNREEQDDAPSVADRNRAA